METDPLKDVGKPKKGNKPLSAMDRLIQQATGKGKNLGREDDPARDDYPTLWEWLTRTSAGIDHIKTPAKLTITMGPEGIIASLTDADLAVSMDTASAHLGNVFHAVEAALTSDTPPIRSWGKKQPTVRKRKSGS